MNTVGGAASAAKTQAPGQPASSGRTEDSSHVFELQKIGLGFFSAAVLGYLAYRLAVRKDERSAFKAACSKLHEAFTNDLAAVENHNLGNLDLMEFLGRAHERHAAAVVAFEHHLPARKRAAFRAAWNRYRYGENADGSIARTQDEGLSHDELLFLCYSPFGGITEPHTGKSAQQRVLERLRVLLAFAT
jgi:hypothetical protein